MRPAAAMVASRGCHRAAAMPAVACQALAMWKFGEQQEGLGHHPQRSNLQLDFSPHPSAALQVAKALLCLAVLLCGALAASAAGVEQARTPASHGLRKLLKSYKCNAKPYQVFQGTPIKTKRWYPEEGFDKEHCCQACKGNSKCWQWAYIDDTFATFQLCHLYNGSAKMKKAPKTAYVGYYSAAGKLS